MLEQAIIVRSESEIFRNEPDQAEARLTVFATNVA
jgi:hypothetical protein